MVPAVPSPSLVGTNSFERNASVTIRAFALCGKAELNRRGVFHILKVSEDCGGKNGTIGHCYT